MKRMSTDTGRPRSRYVKGHDPYCGTTFKAHRSLGLSYPQQGLIFFICLNYEELDQRTREKIQLLCRQVGGAHENALLERMTTGYSTIKVAQKHYISTSTLYTLVRSFFQSWQELE